MASTYALSQSRPGTAIAETTHAPFPTVPVSLGQVVPVEPRLDYQQVLDLIQKTRREVAAVAVVKPPQHWLARPAAVLRFLSGFEPMAATVFGLSGLVAGLLSVGPLLDGFYGFGGTLAGIGALLTGLAVGKVGGSLIGDAWQPAEPSLMLESTDLQRALDSFRKASPRQQAAVAGIVRSSMADLDSRLSAKAAAQRDAWLRQLPKLDPAERRVATLATLVDELRHTKAQPDHLQRLATVLDACTPEERKALAEQLGGSLFDGERFRLHADQAWVRGVYAMLETAKNGEAPAAKAS